MIVLRAARLFDGETLTENATVAIDDGRFVAVPQDGDVVDLGDVTLLPGLIDTHQHLVFNGQGTLEEQVVGFTDDELAERARANALVARRAGITTIRDLGDRNYVTLPLRDDPTLPTLVCSGPPLTITGGHCWYLNGECDDADALVEMVAAHKARGCDVIKIMVTGGILTPTFPMWKSQFDRGDLQRLVDAAHAEGLPVAAHCHGKQGILDAIAVGVDTLEHCSFFTEGGVSDPDEVSVAAVAESGIVVSATLGAVPGFDPPPIVQANIETLLRALGEFVRLGGNLVVGSDAGIGPGKPHNVLPYAAVQLAEVGMPPLDALKAMTSRSAAAIGLGDRKGRVAPGYDADLVAVAGNPLDDMAALHDVRAVYLRGAKIEL
ncbi:MAG: amidohydrolase family protein [Acidimicrobiales bacterium]|nr:amidohydrolase family protein [Acidimicrobiales bacterium]